MFLMDQKPLVILNVALALTAIVLILNLFGLRIPSLGQASYWLDESEPICVTGFEDQTSLFNINQCCSELQRQLECENWNGKIFVDGGEIDVDQHCYSGPSTIEYYVNNKMYNLCKKEGYLGYRVF